MEGGGDERKEGIAYDCRRGVIGNKGRREEDELLQISMCKSGREEWIAVYRFAGTRACYLPRFPQSNSPLPGPSTSSNRQ